MKNWIVGLVIVTMSLVGAVSSDAIIHIVGVQGQCDTTLAGCQAIPLVVTTLCTGTCPPTSQPSLTSTSRFWGGNANQCKTSTDGGATWVNCATQPFAGGNVSVAGAADGSVVAAASEAADCVIKRSTDNGSNWTTVATGVGHLCNYTSGSGSLLRCRTDGNCVLPFFDSGTNNCFTYKSSNSGVTWNTADAGIACSITGMTSVAWDGSVGSMISRAHTGLQQDWNSTGSNTWNTTANWAFNGICVGSFIMNGTAHAMCMNNPPTTYAIRSTLGAVETTVTLPGATVTQSLGGMSVSIGTNILYTLATYTPPSGNSPIGVYVSRDAGTTFNLITTISNNSMGGGDIYYSNSCVYFSAGVSVVFAKIC